MIAWPCPQCGEKLSVGDDHTGPTYVCPLCGTESFVPRDAALARTQKAQERAAQQAAFEAGRAVAPRAPETPVPVADVGSSPLLTAPAAPRFHGHSAGCMTGCIVAVVLAVFLPLAMCAVMVNKASNAVHQMVNEVDAVTDPDGRDPQPPRPSPRRP